MNVLCEFGGRDIKYDRVSETGWAQVVAVECSTGNDVEKRIRIEAQKVERGQRQGDSTQPYFRLDFRLGSFSNEIHTRWNHKICRFLDPPAEPVTSDLCAVD